MNIVFVYRSKHGINVASPAEADKFEHSPDHRRIATLDAAGWIQKAIETHPELLLEADQI